MKKILIVFILLASLVVSLLSCSEPSGPLDISDPTASILTVTLEETGTFKNDAFSVSSALLEEHSVRGEVTLEISGKGGYQAHAVWTQCPDDNFSRYIIYRSGTPAIASNIEAADTSVIFTSVSATSWLDTGVSEGNTYYYAVRTMNEYDMDSWSNEDSVVVPADEPPSPSTLSGSYTGDGTFGQVTLEWTECPDSDFYCYKLYRSENPHIEVDPSSAQLIATGEESNDVTFEDNEVEELTTYYYAVETIDESQLSSWSNEVSVAIPDLVPLLTVFFIDPSHNDYYSGDVILLRTPENYYYLIDGGDRSGSWSCGVEKVLPILDSLGVDTLDGIVGTHPHSDHIGGLIGVLENVPVTKAWDSGWPYSASNTYAEYLQAIYSNGSDYITPRRGDILDWDDSLTVECIHPVDPLNSSNMNNASITLRVTYGSVSFLFTGDLETSGGENVILDALNQGIIDDISADVLKVGHHGSYTSTSYSWLQAVDPNYAAIEVGYGNPYGHPHSEVIQRLENYGALIYRTDQDGTFIMTTDGTNLEIYP
jgi:beta-lactamase superfamily II metal-dependent hydrolase